MQGLRSRPREMQGLGLGSPAGGVGNGRGTDPAAGRPSWAAQS